MGSPAWGLNSPSPFSYEYTHTCCRSGMKIGGMTCRMIKTRIIAACSSDSDQVSAGCRGQMPQIAGSGEYSERRAEISKKQGARPRRLGGIRRCICGANDSRRRSASPKGTGRSIIRSLAQTIPAPRALHRYCYSVVKLWSRDQLNPTLVTMRDAGQLIGVRFCRKS